MAQARFSPASDVLFSFQGLEMERGPAAHRLALRYETTQRGCPDGSTLLVAGELRLDTGPGWLGQLLPDVNLPCHSSAVQPRALRLGTTIDNDQLAALEQARQGRDLQLRVRLQVTLANAPELNYPTTSTEEPLLIRAHDWGEHLERVGALVAVSFGVPLPLDSPDGLRAQAARRLSEAMASLSNGDAEGAVRLARLAMDLHKQLAPPPTYDRKGDLRLLDLNQRFALVRAGLYSVASGAGHDDEVTNRFAYTQADALAVVVCTAAMLQR